MTGPIGSDQIRLVLGVISLLQSSIRGYGQALSADVLKESGIIDSVKPDTHMKKFADLISLTYGNDTDLLVKLNRDCLRAGLSPYEFDKLIWLVYSRGVNEKEVSINISIQEYTTRIDGALRQFN